METAAILSTLYLGVNLVCFVLTTYDNDCFPCPAAATSGKTYHRLEFAATFCFAVVGTLSLVYSPERRFASPLVLKALVFFNINATFVAALFVFINVEKFETLSHEIEYANELTATLVDAMIVCFSSDDLNIYEVNDQLVHKGWTLNALQKHHCSASV